MKPKNFYCRRRKCKYHKGFKLDADSIIRLNVICELENPQVFKDIEGRLCCNSCDEVEVLIKN